MPFMIDSVEVGGENPCRFVVEISNNHNGSLAQAHALIDAAQHTGAEFVKFQAYTPDELITLRGNGPAPAQWGAQGWTMRDLYEKAQTPLAWMPELFAHARDIDIVPFASVFGFASITAMTKLSCPALKIAALDARSALLRAAVASVPVPVLVSLPSWSLDLEGWIRGTEAEVLYCPPGYPTAAPDVELPQFNSNDIDDGGVWLGLSSHCLDPDLPIAAVARGAKLIEMHMQLADTPSELESNISLTEHAFAEMIHRVRKLETML